MSGDIFEVLMPQLGVNDEFIILSAWQIEPGQKVSKGDIIADLETSKASFELEAERDGFCFPLVDEGAEVGVQAPVALIFAAQNGDFITGTLEKYKKQALADRKKEKQQQEAGPRLTKKAKLLAEERNVDLSTLPKGRIIRESDILNMTMASAPKGTTESSLKRIVIYGASQGGRAVQECARLMGEYEVTAFLDDDPALIGRTFYGLPVVSGKELKNLAKKGIFGIASHIPNRDFRKELLKRAELAGLESVNVIHPNSSLAPSLVLGKGNLIKAGSVIGTDVSVGSGCIIDNGVIIPHHNVIGDCCHLAPGVIFGGDCSVGERTLIGLGAVILPRMKIGENVMVSPASCVTHDIPDNAVVSGSPAKIIGKRA